MKLDVIAIGAHPDDVEIGMGGTVAKFVNAGYAVGILDLTNGEPTPRGSVPIRQKESAEAAAILNVSKRITLGLNNRYLQDTPEARAEVAEVFREFRPHILFAPYWVDAHPDHVAASALTEAARFYAKLTNTSMKFSPYLPGKIFYYFACHIKLHVKPSFIVDIAETYDAKKSSIKCYVSQNASSLQTMERVDRNNLYYGSLIQAAAGEAFICREELGLASIQELMR